MRSTLVFVYNADSGLFNALTDLAHKVFSPQTYQCNLCALTHSNLGMHKQWKRFIESLDREVEFLHADELKSRYAVKGLSLPVVFEKKGGKLETLIDTNSINACQNIEDLQQMIVSKMS